MSKKADVSS